MLDTWKTLKNNNTQTVILSMVLLSLVNTGCLFLGNSLYESYHEQLQHTAELVLELVRMGTNPELL